MDAGTAIECLVALRFKSASANGLEFVDELSCAVAPGVVAVI